MDIFMEFWFYFLGDGRVIKEFCIGKEKIKCVNYGEFILIVLWRIVRKLGVVRLLKYFK